MSKSYLKIVGVNFYMPTDWHDDSSNQLTPDDILYIMNCNPLFERITLASPPRVMRATLHSDMAIIWFDIWDSQNGTNAKMLTNHSFNFNKDIAVIWACNMHPGISQCQNCWKWGHITAKCKFQGWECAKCNGPHKTENHRNVAWYCQVNPKAKPPHKATEDGMPCPHQFNVSTVKATI
ncbi:hypothetical protein AN958_07274 [Leucoagaricus sp. SymC.cos]|nr:hypothetical protein AN958_07274 [Leucoagaricus sp. SymC.cos]